MPKHRASQLLVRSVDVCLFWLENVRGYGAMPDTCLFCRIIQGDVATPVVYESEVAFAFLDHRPLFPGHCLVLPRRHIETLRAMPPELLGPFFAEVQLVTRAVEAAMEAQGSFVAMNNRISQSVPHLHVHVVPRSRGDGLKGFFWPRTRYASDEETERVRALVEASIRAAIGTGGPA